MVHTVDSLVGGVRCVAHIGRWLDLNAADLRLASGDLLGIWLQCVCVVAICSLIGWWLLWLGGGLQRCTLGLEVSKLQV